MWFCWVENRVKELQQIDAYPKTRTDRKRIPQGEQRVKELQQKDKMKVRNNTYHKLVEVSQVDKQEFEMDLQLFAEEGEGEGEGQNPSTSSEDEETGSNPEGEGEGSGQDTGEEGEGEKTFDEKYVRDLRKEAAKHRNEKKEFAEKAEKLDGQLKEIQKALGLESDEEPDTEKLNKELQRKDQELKSLKIETAMNKVADKLEADPELTYAVLLRKGELDALDIEEDDVEKELETLVKAAIKENPKLKVEETAPKKSGDDTTDDKGTKPSGTMNDLIRKAAGRA